MPETKTYTQSLSKDLATFDNHGSFRDCALSKAAPFPLSSIGHNHKPLSLKLRSVYYTKLSFKKIHSLKEYLRHKWEKRKEWVRSNITSQHCFIYMKNSLSTWKDSCTQQVPTEQQDVRGALSWTMGIQLWMDTVSDFKNRNIMMTINFPVSAMLVLV